MTYIDGIILPLRDERLAEHTTGAEKFACKAAPQMPVSARAPPFNPGVNASIVAVQVEFALSR